MKRFAAGLLIAASFTSFPVWAQVTRAATSPLTVDLAAGFSMIRANGVQLGCGCFHMYGGSAQVVVNAPSGFGLMFDAGSTNATNIFGSRQNLSLYTYLAGPRYAFHARRGFKPYGEVLAGVAHSSSNSPTDRGSNTIAISAGGGLDYRLNSRFRIRLVDAEFLRTQAPNGGDNRQDQLRVTAGIVFRVPYGR